MTPERLAAETAELEDYFRGGMLATPPSDELRQALYTYKTARLTFHNMTHSMVTTQNPETERLMTKGLLMNLPDLLQAHLVFGQLLTNAIANGSVVNSLRTCGFELNPVAPNFSTVQDLLNPTNPNNNEENEAR